MTLAVDWHGSNLAGWFVSEKIFDCRAYWSEGEFWTRAGNLIKAPKWFKRGMPKHDVDGGIYAGRKGFQAASNATRFGGKWFDEPGLEFVAFDFPGMEATWDKRIREAARALKQSAVGRAVDFFQIAPDCKSYRQLTEFLLKLRPLGGEGACMRNPEIKTYETGRSENLLRFKFDNPFADFLTSGREAKCREAARHRAESARPAVGFDVSRLPYDAEIEYNISAILDGAGDFSLLTKRGRRALLA